MEPARASATSRTSMLPHGGAYRRLIFAAIRRTVEDDEEVLDVFAHVCEALSADRLTRLRRYSDRGERRARFSTFLVTVVHNLTIDWLSASSTSSPEPTPAPATGAPRP